MGGPDCYNRDDQSKVIQLYDSSPKGAVNHDSSNGAEQYDSSVIGAEYYQFSDIIQCDGAATISDVSSVDSDDNTDDEAEVEREPAVLVPAANQPPAGQPLVLEVDRTGRMVLPASLPLIMLTNARSVYNKIDNLKKWLTEIFPDCALISESWDYMSRMEDLTSLLAGTPFQVFSYRRPRGQTGGCCAIIFNRSRFMVEQVHVQTGEGIETVWAMLTPRKLDHKLQHIKRICVSSIYIAPRSKLKSETMDHIIQSIHIIRARYDNNVSFILGGDVNRTDYTDVLDSYGALKQCVTVGTRKQATLEIILSDLLNLYHPPTVHGPLKVDEGKAGKDSDHNIVIFAPRSDANFRVERKKKTIKTRPIPDSCIPSFSREIQNLTWEEVLNEKDIDTKVYNFHRTLSLVCNKYFPEKKITISNLDKKLITVELKTLSRRIKAEYFRNRKSPKWRKLKKEFKKKKKKSIRAFHDNFVKDLKQTNPQKFYKMCRRIGTGDAMNAELRIKCQEGLSNKECAEEIAQFLSAVSHEYEPIDLTKLKRLNNTKSTLPIDIPARLRKEVAVELARPLTDIINSCLAEGVYPALWKREWVSPIPKVKEPEVLKDVRKVASTSDYNKVLESVIKDYITEDIAHNLDPQQFGGKKGHGTEHMLVSLMDRVLKLLDNNNTKSAVLKAGVDWSSAFERGDPTTTTAGFLEMGLRPSIVKLLSSYMTSRQMSIKFNGEESTLITLCGGFPAGSVIGQDCYLVASNNAAEEVNIEDRFCYIDDLEILELVMLSGILQEYDGHSYVPSDLPFDYKYLLGSSTVTQTNLDNISRWTTSNNMKLNPQKCSYMQFSRSKEQFVTRLTVNNNKIDQKSVSKILGC